MMQAPFDLKSALVKPRPSIERQVLDQFGAQIGELAWHRTHVDSTLADMSAQHTDRMCQLASEFGMVRPRILEVGAYAHCSAFVAASRLGGEGWTHDISPDSLRLGKELAREAQINCELTAVAGDFHDLPFEDNMFDLVFIASAVHHTWQPWKVIAELGRVAKPNGIVHLENEPIGRSACLYQFRGNRPGEGTGFENRIEQHGLSHTISSPFPGSRAEALFGIVENDRIPIEVYESSLGQIGDITRFDVDCGGLVNGFETWMLESRPTAAAIADYLIERIENSATDFSSVDLACKLSVPSADVIWPMAYRLEKQLQNLNPSNARDLGSLFGAALRATVVKRGHGPMGNGFRRELSSDGHVLIDDQKSREAGLSIIDVAPEPTSDAFGPDWIAYQEEAGHYSLCNQRADCELQFPAIDSVLAIRMYSVFQDEPYRLSILKNGELCYQHDVSRSESHLASVFVSAEDKLRVIMHRENGTLYELPWGTRLVIKQVPWDKGART